MTLLFIPLASSRCITSASFTDYCLLSVLVWLQLLLSPVGWNGSNSHKCCHPMSSFPGVKIRSRNAAGQWAGFRGVAWLKPRLSRCLNADVTGPTRRQGDSSMSKTRSPQLNMDSPKQEQQLLKIYELVLYGDLYINVERGVFRVRISQLKWIFWIQNFDFIFILQQNFHQYLHSPVHYVYFLFLVPFCHQKEET